MDFLAHSSLYDLLEGATRFNSFLLYNYDVQKCPFESSTVGLWLDNWIRTPGVCLTVKRWPNWNKLFKVELNLAVPPFDLHLGAKQHEKVTFIYLSIHSQFLFYNKVLCAVAFVPLLITVKGK